MSFKCPTCGKMYLLDHDQTDKAFRCVFEGCKTVFEVYHIGGKLYVTASSVVPISDTVPSYTPIFPVKDAEALPRQQD